MDCSSVHLIEKITTLQNPTRMSFSNGETPLSLLKAAVMLTPQLAHLCICTYMCVCRATRTEFRVSHDTAHLVAGSGSSSRPVRGCAEEPSLVSLSLVVLVRLMVEYGRRSSATINRLANFAHHARGPRPSHGRALPLTSACACSNCIVRPALAAAETKACSSLHISTYASRPALVCT